MLVIIDVIIGTQAKTLRASAGGGWHVVITATSSTQVCHDVKKSNGKNLTHHCFRTNTRARARFLNLCVFVCLLCVRACMCVCACVCMCVPVAPVPPFLGPGKAKIHMMESCSGHDHWPLAATFVSVEQSVVTRCGPEPMLKLGATFVVPFSAHITDVRTPGQPVARVAV